MTQTSSTNLNLDYSERCSEASSVEATGLMIMLRYKTLLNTLAISMNKFYSFFIQRKSKTRSKNKVTFAFTKHGVVQNQIITFFNGSLKPL